ncbi:MAG: ABC transporter ATP-binding protein [Chloroflexi bacterium]|nr:ABC transporter ATP-binding protein [Chloroflexota bacterium]
MRSEPAPAITVDQLSKRYYLRGHGQELKTALLSLPAMLFKRRGRQEFWALQDISFSMERGECLGLVGPNGSGKSTLLRVIAGISKPTSGTVTVNGRISTLLELGAGFHPRMSGRENALVNAVLLGLSLAEAREALPSIIEFSELGDFIEQPLRTYSSGMFVRLGFAVAIHVQPEILLIDEVLAVGDAEFQSKCFDHLERLRQDGVTVIIASHDLPSIQRYTDRAVLLDHGRIVLEGPPANVLHEYLTRIFGPGEKSEVKT